MNSQKFFADFKTGFFSVFTAKKVQVATLGVLFVWYFVEAITYPLKISATPDCHCYLESYSGIYEKLYLMIISRPDLTSGHSLVYGYIGLFAMYVRFKLPEGKMQMIKSILLAIFGYAIVEGTFNIYYYAIDIIPNGVPLAQLEVIMYYGFIVRAIYLIIAIGLVAGIVFRFDKLFDKKRFIMAFCILNIFFFIWVFGFGFPITLDTRIGLTPLYYSLKANLFEQSHWITGLTSLAFAFKGEKNDA